MRRRHHGIGLGLAAFTAAACFSGVAQAHFYLEAPPAMTEQNDLGDPQKIAPCGDPGDAIPTGDMTTFAAGETITITIDERIYHPGHYRVALAINDPSELPEAPPVTPTMMNGMTDPCGSTEIQDPPVFPVLADGELVHDTQFNGPQSFQVTLPDDVECDNCTLQVIEYMSSHAAPCFYYHCATIAIEADPGMTSADTGASDGSTSGDGGDTSGGTSNSGSAGTSGATADDGTSGASTTAAGTDGGTDTGGDQDSGDEGCGCSASNHAEGSLAALCGVFGLLGLRLRRR